MLIELKVNDFIETVASSSPAPGGGSCSALSGALGASLAMMMCQLTFGKKNYQQYEEADKQALNEAFEVLQGCAQELSSLVDKDTEAFNQIMAAFKLPKETEDEKKARAKEIQDATWHAIATPLSMAEQSLLALENLEPLVRLGNQNALSDLGVGTLMLQAGLHGAIMNVKINLGSVTDTERAEKLREKIATIVERAESLSNQLLAEIHTKLS